MNCDENKRIVRRLAQAVNSGNLDDLDNVLSPNYVRHDPNPLMKDIGREEYKKAFSCTSSSLIHRSHNPRDFRRS